MFKEYKNIGDNLNECSEIQLKLCCFIHLTVLLGYITYRMYQKKSFYSQIDLFYFILFDANKMLSIKTFHE